MFKLIIILFIRMFLSSWYKVKKTGVILRDIIAFIILTTISISVVNAENKEIIDLARLKNIDDPIELLLEEENKEKAKAKGPVLDPDTQDFVDRISEIKTLTADFQQVENSLDAQHEEVILNEDSDGDIDHIDNKDIKKIIGKVKLSKPNKLSWEITEPEREQQVYITNGSKFWHYDKGIAQVVKEDFNSKRIVNSPLYFLVSNTDKIHENYKVKKNSDDVYFLTPINQDKRESNYATDLELRFQPESSKLTQISFTAAGQKRVKINLKNIKVNSGVSNNSFDFSVPKGVDVIDAQELY